MKSILIDLHNHLISGNDKSELIDSDGLQSYFNKRIKISNVEKIFAFTDHYEKLNNINFEEYKKVFTEISAKFKLLFGIEINVSFSNTNFRHLLIIFNNDFNKFDEFKKILQNSNELNFDKIKTNTNLFTFLNNNDNCFFVPHYCKSKHKNNNKDRNFTLDEIKKWNELFNKNKIKCIEVSANLLTYWLTRDDSNLKEYHVIVASDRFFETKILKKQDKKAKENEYPIASFIYVNDSNSVDYKTIKDFFNQKDIMSNISYEKEKDFTLPGIEYSFMKKNCLIFGKRGSGKTWLLNSLKNALTFNDEDDNDENTNICFIEQFENASVNNKTFKKYNDSSIIQSKNNEHTKINDLFLKQIKNFCEIKTNDFYSESKNKLNNFKKDFNVTISTNCDDECKTLNIVLSKFNFVLPTKNTNRKTEFELLQKLKDSFINLLSNLEEIIKNEQLGLKLGSYAKTISKTIKDNIRPFYDQLKLHTINNEISKYTTTIIEELQQEVQNIMNWKYTFSDLCFEQYFKLEKLLEIYDNYISENEQYTFKWGDKVQINDKYHLIYALKQKEGYKKPKIVLAENHNAEASHGQKSEFFIEDKIEQYLNSNCSYFLFDEPDYAFDSNFIKSFSANLKKSLKNKLVFVATHNHIFWSEFYEGLNDKSYIKCEYLGDKKYSYNQFNFDEFQNKNALETFEADKMSYDIRKEKYNL